jgi:nucleotide-binding universal stress UspA family protein
MRLSKILLPVDFSGRSAVAAAHARALARRFGASIVLLHVARPVDFALGGAELTGAVGAQWYSERLEDWKNQLTQFEAGQFEGLETERVTLEGSPSEEIVEYAHNNAVDLIVMPTHGYGPFRRFLIGSVTARVLHDAACPVFTGAHLADAPVPVTENFQNILCAVDFGPQSETMLKWAKTFAAEFGARLTLVHALPSISSGEARYLDEEFQAVIAKQARAQAARVIEKLDLDAQAIMEHGDPGAVVRDAARTAAADLVIIGRHASTGILGRLRTHAYAIVRESPVPVVSV